MTDLSSDADRTEIALLSVDSVDRARRTIRAREMGQLPLIVASRTFRSNNIEFRAAATVVASVEDEVFSAELVSHSDFQVVERSQLTVGSGIMTLPDPNEVLPGGVQETVDLNGMLTIEMSDNGETVARADFPVAYERNPWERSYNY